MKQQVFVIHGGNAYASDEAYMEALQKKVVKLEDLGRKDWKDALQKNLGEEYEVYLLAMPNKQNAHYKEWEIWFEKYIPFFNDGVVLIGHSLGAIFLARYFSEKVLAVDVRGIFLVAPPYSSEVEEADLEGFTLSEGVGALSDMEEELHIYHSKDDMVVPYAHFEKFEEALPNATLKTFTDRGHFNMEAFPELVEDIKNLEPLNN